MGKRIFRIFWHVKESPLNMLYSWFSSNAFASLDMCVCVRVSDGYCLVSDGFCLGSLNPGSTLHPGFPRHISTLRQQVGRMSRSELPSQAPGRRFPEFHTICCFVYKGI